MLDPNYAKKSLYHILFCQLYQNKSDGTAAESLLGVGCQFCHFTP